MPEPELQRKSDEAPSVRSAKQGHRQENYTSRQAYCKNSFGTRVTAQPAHHVEKQRTDSVPQRIEVESFESCATAEFHEVDTEDDLSVGL